MKSYFRKISGLQIHYRQAGSGKFVFLLHASPRSSKMMEPLMTLLSQQCTLVAPDIPGYGYSDPLKDRPSSVYDYVSNLHELITQFTHLPITLYGTATGAQIAIAYSLTYPEKIKSLFLDNSAHFSDKECSVIMENYFPDFTPQLDGSHLQKIWQHVCDSCIYFPWYDKTDESRIAATLPSVEVIQQIFQDYLIAGANYADAYKVAFKHERAEKVQQLKVNTIIFKWKGSPILKYVNLLLAFDLPKNIKVIETDVQIIKRYEQMKEAIEKAVIEN